LALDAAIAGLTVLAPVRGWTVPVGAAVLSCGVLSAMVACGDQPGAADLWARPAQSAARDAHVTITAAGATTGDRVAIQGDGTVVFKPRPAIQLRLQAGVGGLPGQLDVLEVGGVTYERVTVDQKWARSTTPAPDPTWTGATEPRVVGQDTVAGSRAWHLEASRGGSPLEMWVRMSDGYPLKVVATTGAGMVFTFAFDGFNSGQSVVAPLAFELEPPARRLSGQVGDVLSLNAGRIAVLAFEDDVVPDDDLVRPRPGNRFVVVEVSVENTGSSSLSTFLDWRLSDPAGSTWHEALAVRQPSFLGGELGPGEAARGFLTYEVTATASQLTLTVKLDDDTAVFALS
jgi:hypothetical protein